MTWLRAACVVCALVGCSKKKEGPPQPTSSDDDSFEDHPSYRYLRYSVTVAGAPAPETYERAVLQTLSGANLYPVAPDGKVADYSHEPTAETARLLRITPPRDNGAIVFSCIEEEGPVYTIQGRVAGGSVLPRCEVTLTDAKGTPLLRTTITHKLEGGETIPAEYASRFDVRGWSLSKYWSSNEMMIATSAIRELLGVGDPRDPEYLVRNTWFATPEVITAAIRPLVPKLPAGDQANVLLAAHDVASALAIGAPAIPALADAMKEQALSADEHANILKGLVAMDTPDVRLRLIELAKQGSGYFDSAGDVVMVEYLAEHSEWDLIESYTKYKTSDRAVQAARRKALAARPR